MESNQSILKKYWIFGYAVGCPALENDKNCPFHAIRELTFEKRFAHVEKMTYDEIRSFMFAHSRCHFNERI